MDVANCTWSENAVHDIDLMAAADDKHAVIMECNCDQTANARSLHKWKTE